MLDALLAAVQPWMQPAFVVGAVPFTWLELVAVALALAMVVCNIRVIHWGWPLAIASSLLYFLLFWQYRLYGDAVLQIFFAVVAGWGWWQWLRGRDTSGRALAVHRLSARGRALNLLALGLTWPLVGWYLDHYTDTDVPYWDAFPTAASVLGQFLLGRKLVENWPVWIVVNGVSVALFVYKDLWLTAGLYLVFIALSVVGWRAWSRQIEAASPAQGARR